MNAAKAILTILLADTYIIANLPSKVYVGLVPQNTTLPYVVMYSITTSYNETKTGAGTNDTTRLQIDHCATTLQNAYEIHDAVKAAIDHYTGISAGIDISNCFIDNTLHDYTEDTQIHRVISDYIIRINNQ